MCTSSSSSYIYRHDSVWKLNQVSMISYRSFPLMENFSISWRPVIYFQHVLPLLLRRIFAQNSLLLVSSSLSRNILFLLRTPQPPPRLRGVDFQRILSIFAKTEQRERLARSSSAFRSILIIGNCLSARCDLFFWSGRVKEGRRNRNKLCGIIGEFAVRRWGGGGGLGVGGCWGRMRPFKTRRV